MIDRKQLDNAIKNTENRIASLEKKRANTIKQIDEELADLKGQLRQYNQMSAKLSKFEEEFDDVLKGKKPEKKKKETKAEEPKEDAFFKEETNLFSIG